MNPKTARNQYIIAVLMFGVNPLILRYVSIPSEAMALYRSVLGVITLLVYYLITGRRLDFTNIKKHLKYLVSAGVCLGLNWIFLFEAYVVTKVSVASLCNYMAPTLTVCICALFFKEKIKRRQGLCVAAAFLGIVLVSGVLDGDLKSININGLILGWLAAASFVVIILSNKKLKNVDSFDSVISQLTFAFLTTLIYVPIKNGGFPVPSDIRTVVLVLLIGIVNAGVAYIFYYGPMPHLPVQTIAIIGYLESVECVLISVLIFKEPLSLLGVIGAVLIIGAAVISELYSNKA